MKKILFLIMMMLLLASCSTAEEQVSTQPDTAPAVFETEEISVFQETTAPEETEPAAIEEQEKWYYLYEWNNKLQMRCLVRNPNEETITMQSVKVTYYQGTELVEEKVYGQDRIRQFLHHLEKKLELTYGDGCVLLVSDTAMEGKFDRAICEVFLTDEHGTESSQTFQFTMNEEEATTYSMDDRVKWDVAVSNNAVLENSWNLAQFPHNETDENIHYIGNHRFTFYNGLPLSSDYFDVSSVEPIYRTTFEHLAPGDIGSYVTGTRVFPQNHIHNEEEIVMVYRTDSGKLYLQTFHFLLDETHSNTIQENIIQEQIPKDLGEAQYSIAEIRQMVDSKLSIEELAEKIATLPDLMLYLREAKYSIGNQPNAWLTYDGIQWGYGYSANTYFTKNQSDCGGCNLVNYILQGDYDEQGYVREENSGTRHIFNYFVVDGVYYFFDLIGFINGGTYFNPACNIFITENPDEFGAYYVSRNHSKNSQNNDYYLVMLYMYPWEDNFLPAGLNPQVTTPKGKRCMNILSDEIENTLRILYLDEEKYTPVFQQAPEKSRLPIDAQ